MLLVDRECEIMVLDRVNVAIRKGDKLQKVHTNGLTMLY